MPGFVMKATAAFSFFCLAGLPNAWAQQSPAPPPGAPAPPAAEAPAAAPTSNAMANPSMTGPLVANPNPAKFDAGPLGPVYVTGVVSGLALGTANPNPAVPFLIGADHSGHIDISNGQAIVQTTSGPLQFYAQAGVYSLPTLGVTYIQADSANHDFFGPLPVGYVKWQPTDEFSLQGGKLPTLIGAEYTFTFQNMNIQRGLLWNMEPAISRGVQANYTWGPLAFAASFNDGYYSDRFNWLDGSVTWTIDKVNSLVFAGGGNLGSSSTGVSPPVFTTNPALNNGSIFNVIYTYNDAPWTITPYFQYTSVDAKPAFGWIKSTQSYGGAILANYAINDNINLAGRFEVVGSSGSATDGSANVVGFGSGSGAFSFTVTPTYQAGIFFLRGEASVVSAFSTNSAVAPVFGHTGTKRDQERVLIEGGFVF